MTARLLLFIAFILRISFVLLSKPLQNNVWSDMQGYVTIADEIMEGKWDAYHYFQSIGYPFIIILFKSFFTNWGLALALAQAILSFFTVWIFYRITTLSFGKKIGFIALLIETFHFPWIAYAGYALPESIFTFFLATTAWFSYKLVVEKKYIPLFALGWGLSFLCAFWLKGTHVLWGPIFLIALIFYQRKRALVPVILISLIVGLGILGHGVLAYSTIGKVQLSASAGGLNFVEGKCPTKENKDTVGYSWQSPLYYQLRMDKFKKWDRPFTDSSYFMKEGLKCIVKSPFVLFQSLEGIPFLFYGNTMWPLNQKTYADKVRLLEVFYALFFVVGLILYGRRVYLRGASELEVIVWITPIISLFLCVYIFKSEIRFRGPFDGWIIALALSGWSEMRRREDQSVLT